MFTVTEVAEKLKVSPACVYALVDAGKLSCYRIGVGRGVIRISEAQLQLYLDTAEQDMVAVTPRATDFVFLPPQT